MHFPKELFAFWFIDDKLEVSGTIDSIFLFGAAWIRGGVCDGFLFHFGPFSIGVWWYG